MIACQTRDKKKKKDFKKSTLIYFKREAITRDNQSGSQEKCGRSFDFNRVQLFI